MAYPFPSNPYANARQDYCLLPGEDIAEKCYPAEVCEIRSKQCGRHLTVQPDEVWLNLAAPAVTALLASPKTTSWDADPSMCVKGSVSGAASTQRVKRYGDDLWFNRGSEVASDLFGAIYEARAGAKGVKAVETARSNALGPHPSVPFLVPIPYPNYVAAETAFAPFPFVLPHFVADESI